MKKSFLAGFASIFYASVVFANTIAPNQDVSAYLKYYEDGIYDTIKQIQKDAEEGLTEYPLDSQIKGNIVVAVEIKNSSVTDIVRIRTLAIKNNYTDSVTAKNIKNGKEYIVFDSFDRDADAEYTIKRLSDYGVDGEKVYAGKWVKSPIVIRKIVDDLQKGIFANMPVKVIEIERVVYRDTNSHTLISPKGTIAPNAEKQTPKTEQQPSTKNRTTNTSLETSKTKKLGALINNIKKTNNFSLKDNSFEYLGNHYTKGDSIDGFEITKAYSIPLKDKTLRKLIFRFDDYTDNHMTKIIKIDTKTELKKVEPTKTELKKVEPTKTELKKVEPTKTELKKVEPTKTELKKVEPTKTELKNQQVSSIEKYSCNFTRIKTLYKPDSESPIKTVDTDYKSISDSISQEVFKDETKTNVDFVFFKAAGLSVIGIRSRTWEALCKKI